MQVFTLWSSGLLQRIVLYASLNLTDEHAACVSTVDQTLNMETLYSPETFVTPYKTTLCNLEDGGNMVIRNIEPNLQDFTVLLTQNITV